MARKASSDRRDAALLHISQRLAETDGKANPTALYKELKAAGQGYRKTDFLRDFAGVKGTPQKTPTPGQLKGGIISGVMRRKDVKALPRQQQAAIKAVSSRSVDAVSATGEGPWKKMRIYTMPGKTIAIEEGADWEEVENLPDGAEVLDNVNVATIDPENMPLVFEVMNQIYDRLT